MLDVDKLRSVPTLYPSTNWAVAQVYATSDYDRLCDKIKKLFGFNCQIRAVTSPYWISREHRDEHEVLTIAPIFPEYVFLDLSAPSRSIATDEVEGAFKILTNSGEIKEPYLLTPQEVIHIIGLTSSSLALMNPETYGLLGCEVTIIDGLLKDFSGKVVEDGHTLKIELNVSSKKVLQVKIDRSKVAKKSGLPEHETRKADKS